LDVEDCGEERIDHLVEGGKSLCDLPRADHSGKICHPSAYAVRAENERLVRGEDLSRQGEDAFTVGDFPLDIILRKVERPRGCAKTPSDWVTQDLDALCDEKDASFNAGRKTCGCDVGEVEDHRLGGADHQAKPCSVAHTVREILFELGAAPEAADVIDERDRRAGQVIAPQFG
jgi:hypothetical protein